eukprot:7383325-Prymnesium_polylepis.2
MVAGLRHRETLVLQLSHGSTSGGLEPDCADLADEEGGERLELRRLVCYAAAPCPQLLLGDRSREPSEHMFNDLQHWQIANAQ